MIDNSDKLKILQDRIDELEKNVELNNMLMKDLYKFIERELGLSGVFLPDEFDRKEIEVSSK